MKQRKIGHPCKERTECRDHFRTFFWCLQAVSLMLSCWLILSGRQTFSHEAGTTTIHNPLYLPMYTKKSLKGRFDRAVHFSIVPWNPTSSQKTSNNHQPPVADFCSAARLLCWPKHRRKHHWHKRKYCYIPYVYNFVRLPMLRVGSSSCKSADVMEDVTLHNVRHQLATKASSSSRGYNDTGSRCKN